MAGRSNATRTKFIRPKGVNKFVFGDCDIANPISSTERRKKWLVGQMQRNPNLCDERSKQIGAEACD
ncbi:MAG: hypothetical protein PHG56_01605 [Tissierellia bacterium]|jgi:hypothetical protein|nr:hypothetical protein [Tissierellia bacterium]MDD3226222.1 hypothetical protein [Tissierellia bacterium]MDD3751014.1 hypothetical protein [Tissierellia bacterium]MDD4046015.1 hypothetical protein [Tissierellia bacterium]MDD4677920.1 hypothetical protein [Tissierellia bacterium]